MHFYILSTFCFRIRNEKQGGAWCPKEEVSKESFEYLQIDLGELKVITIIETQGHFGHGQVRIFHTCYTRHNHASGLIMKGYSL